MIWKSAVLHMIFDELAIFEGKVHSQNGEDGVLEVIFEEIGVTNRYFVEFGCEDAIECNGAYLLETGWQGLLMDAGGISKNPRAVIRQEFVTAANIGDLLAKYEVPHVFDLLSIDIDGNDYWVWKAIEHRPRVVVIEYNAHIHPTIRSTIEHEPEFRWSGTDYFGASLRALKELGEHKGYVLVYCESHGINAFFVEATLLPRAYVPRPLEALYRPPNYDGKGARHPSDPTRTMIDPGPLSPS